MDSALGTAARALSLGDPVLALKYVALRKDAAALALRGIAMAQLGELKHAHTLLGRAANSFGTRDPAAHARCVLAQAEVALALRELSAAGKGLEAACALLEERGDADNALFARLLQVRRWVLLGELARAQAQLEVAPLQGAPTRLLALAGLAQADLEMKRANAIAAQDCLARAHQAAKASGIQPLCAEIERALQRLAAPVARLVRHEQEHLLRLHDLAALLPASGSAASAELIIDACRREVRCAPHTVPFLRRPVLLALAVALGQRSPHAVARDKLIEQVFSVRRVNDSHRARLRVELGRLRKLLRAVARVEVVPAGYLLQPLAAQGVAVLLPPEEGEANALLALLRSGEAWATSALAEAVGKSQRAVQRALVELERQGKVQAHGKGRAQRWLAATEIAATLLLVAPGSLS